VLTQRVCIQSGTGGIAKASKDERPRIMIQKDFRFFCDFLNAISTEFLELFLSPEENHAGSLLTIQALSNDQIFKRVGVIQKI